MSAGGAKTTRHDHALLRGIYVPATRIENLLVKVISGKMRPAAHIIICLLLVALASACRQTPRPARAEERRSVPVGETRWGDADNDGIPEGAELRAFTDRENFRRWFTAIAELQFYQASEAWNPEQRDCAGLVRFAWREALRRHDRVWFKRMGAAYDPLAPDVRAYDLNSGVLGEKIFRTAPGAPREEDLRDGRFAEFADARTLKDFNSEFVSRDRRRAEAGDLIFFFQPWVQRYPYHVMIYLGAPHQREDDTAGETGDDWAVYHTGVSPNDAGTVRKVRLASLDRHPDHRWRPVASNENFLGFYRLKILR